MDSTALTLLICPSPCCTTTTTFRYPIVYLFPMLGLTGTGAIVAIQLGYSVSDMIAKCGVGLLVYNITNAKSIALKSGTSEETPLYGAT